MSNWNVSAPVLASDASNFTNTLQLHSSFDLFNFIPDLSGVFLGFYDVVYSLRSSNVTKYIKVKLLYEYLCNKVFITRTKHANMGDFLLFVTQGKSGPECKHCKADPDAECRFCSCCVCGGKQDAHMQLLCDECNMAFHIYCLNPPLATIPDDEDW